MPPFNPFLRSFYRSTLPTQCQPVAEHILLVPTTEVLLYAKDTDSNLQYVDCCAQEDFLACHVIHSRALPAADNRDTAHAPGNVRETKARPKQYSTINGKSVIIKDNFVYSNKGFKTLNQAQILHDQVFYPDSLDGQQWLVYYISRPMVGTFRTTPIIPAFISDEPSRERKMLLAEATGEHTSTSLPRKKEVKNFADLLGQFPMISRQMQNGLEDALRTFIAGHEKPVTTRPSRSPSVSSQRSRTSLSDSITSIKSSLSGSTMIHPTALELEADEERMRIGLESTINTAIELFQSVDKTQLSLLGANTKLTGPMVERMIERYIMEQLHDQTVFQRICHIRRSEDTDLDHKLRRMCDVDIAQVGIPIEDGIKGKRAMASRLKKGIDVFKKMGTSSSPQEMLEILLATQRAIATTGDAGLEKEISLPMVNADLLVSMLLIVVIRSGVRHLHSRLLYMRYFIFIDEVETGEQGYALATLEAVLVHLSSDARALRRASKRNRALWQAAKEGNVRELKAILDSSSLAPPIPEDTESSAEDLEPRQHILTTTATNTSLEHVFPFQRPPTPPPEVEAVLGKPKKRVSMAPRSQSQSSIHTSEAHSRTMSIDSTAGSVTDDVAVDKLAQTQDAEGNSVLMMAVDAKQLASLRFLLSLPAQFRLDFILDDVNDEGTTLLSAAVQSGDERLTLELVDHIEKLATLSQIEQYLRIQDISGRCVAHYLFTQPSLITHFGRRLPWRLKDKNGQTPLFALCRSYDNDKYKSMVETALRLTTDQQDDGQPLHLDDHVDTKGNTLLHIVNEPRITLKLLRHCDSDVNSANDKRFTPLMVGSKYGKIDLVRALFGDPRADITLREYRGLSALELAKDDEVRNQIDDLVLLSSPARIGDRTTTVVRSFFVEDATIRLVLKSGAHHSDGSITVSTCRRSLADFENLASWLSTECPASWLPSNFNLPSPFALPSRPSRAILRDTQLRLNAFFQALLSHTTFATHEMVWEFFLVPELDTAMLSERSRRKAEARVDNLRDDYDPVTDVVEVENFVSSAKEQVQRLSQATRKVIRAVNQQRMKSHDFSESLTLLSSAMATLTFLPHAWLHPLERYARLMTPTDAAPINTLYYTFRCTLTSALAIQNALDRPALLIGSMAQSERVISKSKNSLSRANRWTPNLALFEDTKRAVAAEAWQKEAKARRELETLGCELRYTMVTVASELSGWQDTRATQGRQVLKDYAQAMLVKERAKLEGLRRALREVRKG